MFKLEGCKLACPHLRVLCARPSGSSGWLVRICARAQRLNCLLSFWIFHCWDGSNGRDEDARRACTWTRCFTAKTQTANRPEGGKAAADPQSQRLGPIFSQQPHISRRLCDLWLKSRPGAQSNERLGLPALSLLMITNTHTLTEEHHCSIQSQELN